MKSLPCRLKYHWATCWTCQTRTGNCRTGTSCRSDRSAPTYAVCCINTIHCHHVSTCDAGELQITAYIVRKNPPTVQRASSSHSLNLEKKRTQEPNQFILVHSIQDVPRI